MKALLVIVQLCLIFVNSKDLPSYVHPCKRNDAQLNDCILRTAKEILPKLRNGIPEMALLPLDPFYVSSISISSKGETMELDIDLPNFKMMGLGSFEVISFSADIENGEIHAQLYLPEIRIVSDYVVKGKIMLFNMQGSGPYEFNATGMPLSLGWYGKFYMKDDEQYLRFEKLDLDYDMKTITINFHNLFTGHDELTQAANKIFNENIMVLKDEMNPIVKRIISNITMDYVNNLFAEFSVNQLFPM